MFRTYSATAPPRSRPTRRRRADGRPRVGVARRVAARSSSHRCGRPRRMRRPDPLPAARGRAFAERDAAGSRGPSAWGRTRRRGRRRGGRSRAARPIRCCGWTDPSRARWPARSLRAARKSWPAAGRSPLAWGPVSAARKVSQMSAASRARGRSSMLRPWPRGHWAAPRVPVDPRVRGASLAAVLVPIPTPPTRPGARRRRRSRACGRRRIPGRGGQRRSPG